MEELPKNEKEYIMEDDTWLTPIEVFYKQGKNRKYKYVKCMCKCGNEKNVRLDSYRSGKRKNPIAKLSETQVREIRNSTLNIKELAIKYNVSRSTIRDILNNKYWRWVK